MPATNNRDEPVAEQQTSDYVLHRTEKSRCPHCNQPVEFLHHEEAIDQAAFYIC